jgi:uncharacterized protein YkwD
MGRVIFVHAYVTAVPVYDRPDCMAMGKCQGFFRTRFVMILLTPSFTARRWAASGTCAPSSARNNCAVRTREQPYLSHWGVERHCLPNSEQHHFLKLLLALSSAFLILTLSAPDTGATDRQSTGKPQAVRAVKPTKTPAGSWKSEEILIAEDTVFQLTNRARNLKGVPSLIRSPALHVLAQRHSEHMCRAGMLKHESEAFPQPWRLFMQRLAIVRVRSGGENIAFHTIVANPRKWAEVVFKGWLSSPPHAKNILDRKFRYVGVGIELCGGKLAYATQEFSGQPGIMPESGKAPGKPVP